MSAPLVTILMLTYKSESYVREALQSALAQTYSPIEILVSDDTSPDDTWKVLTEESEVYDGPHQLSLHRNETNLGPMANYNASVARAKGELIVECHGDDISDPRRVEKIVDAWLASGRTTTCFFSGFEPIDGDGNRIEAHAPCFSIPLRKGIVATQYLAEGGAVIAAVSAYTRRVSSDFGPVEEALFAWDRVVPFRAALLGDVVHIAEPLVFYRRHTGNMSVQVDEYPDTQSFVDDYRFEYRDLCLTLRSHLRDIARARELMPDRADFLDDLEHIAGSRLQAREAATDFLAAPWYRRPGKFVTLPGRHLSGRAILSLLLVVTVPWVLYTFRQYSARIRER